ncbi:transcriptional regulator [Mucilaginibacter sp. OK098]|uniref:winged helix-turn-helix domain-containing protein n=1 Tax=Mucilaginibacter sp. OK098 TaxID=1855297 RepID=UPI000914D9BE|nr:winged helix-turn-helix domain-containing protein [Mucilaginibacter sp. OK098]SHM10000.1 DNA-binding winged helix-turn-helix (wHTH) domain-containing protein [Mucilaginibacter sp. OK098]
MIEKPFIINNQFFITPLLGLIKQNDGQNETRLEPRLMHLLCMLVANKGELVTRALLTKEVWDNYGNADEGLTQAISYLRKIFNDDGKTLIETVPKKGYVLNAIITIPKTENNVVKVNPNKKKVYWIAVVVITALIIGGYFIFRTSHIASKHPADVINGAKQNDSAKLKSPDALETSKSKNADKIPDTAKNSKPSPDLKK